MTKIHAIIAAAGQGVRAKQNGNKIFAKIDNVEIIKKTILKFSAIPDINDITIVYADGELNLVQDCLKSITTPLYFVKGGNTRVQSINNALNTIEDGIVLIHDGARPYISTDTIKKCITKTIKEGTCVVCSNCTNTIIETDDYGNAIASTRKNRLQAETPQCFYVDKIKKAYSYITPDDNFTDDAGIYTSFIGKCSILINEGKNTKITYPEDIISQHNLRAGIGFDLHTLVEGRKLILGGTEIPHTKGLLGHSDADVLIHSIMDALLSGAGLRDIGYYFPDTDDRYKGISSTILLEKVITMIKAKGFSPYNISCVVMVEKPKLSKFIPTIQENLSSIIQIPTEMISISLTTLEGIGIIGREEGIAVQTYCLLKKEK